jgi:putative membrane protein
LLEWATALIAGSAATAFLGSQGDPWDTQQDMFMALLGALCALLFFSYWQNRQMRALPRRW